MQLMGRQSAPTQSSECILCPSHSHLVTPIASLTVHLPLYLLGFFHSLLELSGFLCMKLYSKN